MINGIDMPDFQNLAYLEVRKKYDALTARFAFI